MKYKSKIGAILLSICLILPMFSMVAHAASGSISISSVSGNVGSTVTITCTVKCDSGAIGTADVVLVYEPANLEYIGGSGGYSLTGGSGSVVYRGLTPDGTSSSLSFTMQFKILKEGSHKVSSTSVKALNLNEQELVVNGTSGTITGKVPSSSGNGNGTGNSNGNSGTQQPTKDSNNKLNSLQVYPGTLTPAFSTSTMEYTVTVPADTTEVTISATPQSSKATVSVTGGKDLKLGANEARVVVVAENGSSIAYTITIMCGEEEKIQIDGTEYTIYEDFADDQIPTGFTRTEVTYNERQYGALVHTNDKLYLLNLQNDAGTTFYIYNQETQEFYPFVQIAIAEGKYIIPLPLNTDIQEFANCETAVINVQDKNLEAWELDEEFSVVYVLNQDGVETLYRYDEVDGTFQRYTDVIFEEAEPVPVEKTLFPNQYYLYAIAGLGALTLILLVSMIYFIASRKRRHEGRKRKVVKRAEKKRLKEEKLQEKQRQKEEKEAEKQRQLEEKEAEKQRKIEEKQRKKDEKKRKKQDKE